MKLSCMSLMVRFLGVILMGVVASCSKSGVEPSYLQVTPPVATSIDSLGRVDYQQYSAFWYFSASQLIGVLDAPTLSHQPSIASPYTGVQPISVVPGVRQDGVLSSHIIYPVLQPFSETKTLAVGQTQQITPVFKYKSGVRFLIYDDFENSSRDFGKDLDTDADSRLAFESAVARNGSTAAKIVVDTMHRVNKVGSNLAVPTDNVSQRLYFLELDYKATNTFTVYVRSISQLGGVNEASKIVLYPKDSWNKVYLNLTKIIRTYNATNLEIAIGATLDPEYNNTDKKGVILLDNMKLLESY